MNELTDANSLMRRIFKCNSDRFKCIAFDKYGNRGYSMECRRKGAAIEWVESMSELNEDEDEVSMCLVFGIKQAEVQWYGCAKF